MKTKRSSYQVALIVFGFIACSQAVASEAHSYALKDLKSGNIQKIQKERSDALAGDDLRLSAIREIALSVGASAGLAWQFQNSYEEMLVKEAKNLDAKFDFSKVKLSPGVLPPVISQSFDAYEAQSDDLVTIGTNVFKIEKPARIVSSYPTWRDYLKPNYSNVDLPPSGYMPKTKKERAVWDAAVEEGYEAGRLQAMESWRHSLGELHNDYEGMILYRTLLLQGKITPTVLSSRQLGTVVDESGRVMSLNVNQIGITAHSQFDRESADRNGSGRPAVYKSKSGKKF